MIYNLDASFDAQDASSYLVLRSSFAALHPSAPFALP
jgi:hypothetical protein